MLNIAQPLQKNQPLQNELRVNGFLDAPRISVIMVIV